MKTNKNTLSKVSFLIAFTFACLTTHSNVLSFYGGNDIPILLKLLLIVVAIGLLTYINKDNKDIINKYPPIIANISIVILIFDFYVTELSGTILLYKIWWLGAIFVAEATLFLTITLSKVNYYNEFYNRFWKEFTPTFIYTFIFCFIRKPFSCERTINYIPFKRGFKFLVNFLKNPTGTFENPLYFFGNIIFFIPIPFIIRTFFPKLKDKYLLLIGFLLPILLESYQYFFYCGDVDIDDLILNWAGLEIGFLIEKAIKNKLLRNA